MVDEIGELGPEGDWEPGAKLDRLTRGVIGAAIEVHRTLGPGLLESVYEEALCLELTERRIPFARQVRYSWTTSSAGSVKLGSICWSRTYSLSS